MFRKLFAFILILGTVPMVNADSPKTLEVVPSVDLSRHTGKWYEIARLPNRFQKNCAGEVTAAYSLREDNQLQVVNECRQKNGRTDGPKAAPGSPA